MVQTESEKHLRFGKKIKAKCTVPSKRSPNLFSTTQLCLDSCPPPLWQAVRARMHFLMPDYILSIYFSPHGFQIVEDRRYIGFPPRVHAASDWGLVCLVPWQSCLAQAASSGVRFWWPGVRISAWAVCCLAGLHPNKPWMAEQAAWPGSARAAVQPGPGSREPEISLLMILLIHN